MNHNIPPGVTRWTPSVTHLQDQWTAKNPGLARGKVWQPTLTLPPQPNVQHFKFEDLENEELKDVVTCGGYPLDLSTLRSRGANRQADSPLDLSLKTRKRCADSTLQQQHIAHVGKKLCFPSQERVINRSSHVPHGITESSYVPNITNVDYLHQIPDHVTTKRDYSYTSNVPHAEPSLTRQNYSVSVPKQHVQNIQTIQHRTRTYLCDQTELRNVYPPNSFSKQYLASNIQSFNSEISKVPSHLFAPCNKVSHQHAQEVPKYHMYLGSVQKERQDYKDHPHCCNLRPDIVASIPNSPPSSSKSMDTTHNQVFAHAKKQVSNLGSSKYTGTRPPNISYDFACHNTTTSTSCSPSYGYASPRSQSCNTNRPSVLTSRLQFKQHQECCSPDSTNNTTGSGELPHPIARSYMTSTGNTCVSQDKILQKQIEMKSACVSTVSYAPASTEGYDSYMPPPSNTISNRKTPSNKVILGTSETISPTLSKVQTVPKTRSILFGTSVKTEPARVPGSHSVIRNPRPRLWNPNQLKHSSYQSEEEIEEQISTDKPQLDLTPQGVVPVQKIDNTLEIFIPTSTAPENKIDQKPKPFARKHIIMNAFRNDESMKNILNEPLASLPAPVSEAVKNPNNVLRSQENVIFISPESPKMPTLSPQQKLPAPKVSPLMREPPTLDIASSQGNKRKQKVSPNSIQKHTFEEQVNQSDYKQDYSIQPQSSFPQRQKTSYKRIPVANVAPMVHGKCPVKEEHVPQLEKGNSSDLKQIPMNSAPQSIHAYRVNSSIRKKHDMHDVEKSMLEFSKECHNESFKTNVKNKRSKLHYADKVVTVLFKKSVVQSPKQQETDGYRSSSCLIRNLKDTKKQTKRKLIISNTKRKADEIRKRIRGRHPEKLLSGSDTIVFGRNRKRLPLSKNQKGFVDFKPKVLETRTRKKPVKKRHYHRNAAYEKELWRDENRKAFRNRHRVRPFTKKVNTKQETDSQITFSAKEDVQLTDLTEQVETNSPTADGDSSGTWEIKNTSTTLRNGKSKVVSMKILFKPQEQGRLRRKIRKRGKIRCSLQKNASATNKVISQYQQQFYHMAAYKEELYLPTEQKYSQEYFDPNESLGQCMPSPYMHSLPEVKKLSVCKDTGETVLHRAARMGHEDVALSYLQTGIVDVNVRDNAGYTPLHESCVSGNIVIARMLLSYGAIVNCSSQDGIRPIHDAVDNDFVHLVRLLLSYGADPTISTYGGKTLLRIAHSQKMRSLIKGYLGDINGFEGTEDSVWEFGNKDDGVFDDLPSDPETESNIFEESPLPLIQEYQMFYPKTNERSLMVLLKDVTEFLHIKTGDLLKDKFIKSAIIEEAKENFQETAEKSSYYARLNSVLESSCRLLPVNNLNVIIERYENKKYEKGNTRAEQERRADETKCNIEKKKALKDFDHLNDSWNLLQQASSKSPKYKSARSYLDL